ncbi:hypothetical protein C8J57DRAFT_751635 [Mycena rebaudengoi]|nr:hypothetical protein C8J57DRAFT_751635 [Mycena rebaudengoi]
MRDEDFDASYENLLTLSGIIGDVKPKSTPQHVIADLESGLYQEWATPESDKRCPICLDDYEPSDSVLKLADCRHWLHKECLEQWLKGARTCPVCRKDVKGKAKQRTPHHHHHHGPGPSRRREDDGPSGSGGSAGPSTTGGSNAPWMNYLRQ